MTISLREYIKEDDTLLMSWINSARLTAQWAGTKLTYPLTKEQLDKYRGEAAQRNFTAYDPQTSEAIGHISLGQLGPLQHSARIGKVFISPEHRGKGYATKMVHKACQIAFEEMNLHRVSLGVWDFNMSAIRVYEKIGFKREGLLRENMPFEGEMWSLVEMGLLRREWVENQ
ncbi:GNAT family N-acetyltransferase [Bacillus fonticola]|uniref:GNAT family N-acetyltransferase n=1 Tax=Bacillus fonticola TaxID=2728853 RepID=UPI001475AAEE|nr:GNAT family protein [Bacillus fonticola]